MGCCGGSTVRTYGTDQPTSAPGPVLFEYQGDGTLTLFGRLTGVRYHFPGPGTRLHVDARDASAFDIIRGFRRVS